MKELVEWFNQSVQDESQHPLILIGIFIQPNKTSTAAV